LAALPGRSVERRVAGLALAGAFLYAVFIRVIVPSGQAPELWLVGSYIVVLALLQSQLESSPAGATTQPGSRVQIRRRELLLRSGTVLGGAAILLALLSVQPLLRALATRRLFPYRPPRGLQVVGLADLVTPSDRFYVMDKVLQYPEIGPPGWRLVVEGEVARSFSLDFGALLARRAHHRYVTLECVDNPVGGSLIGNALWSGIDLEELLREAGARGDIVVFHAADRYTESVSRAELRAAGAMVAYAMNGAVLRREHGYPARLLLPGIYGFKNVKWLERIEVVHLPSAGDWRGQGWTETGRIQTTVRIDVARRTGRGDSRGARPGCGDEIVLAGVAFAGRRGIEAVEVRVNAGPWRRATLGPALSEASWVQWAVRLQAPGQARIEARAIDGEGRGQSGVRRGAYPDGATGWASVTV
jgi:DMSO/TMAO reductase YedYZ molybdopterin-dependent catalytic subunit